MYLIIKNDTFLNWNPYNTDVKTYLTNNLKTVINQSINNDLQVNSSSNQTVNYIFRRSVCNGKTVTLSQQSIISQIAENISKTVVSNVLENKVLNDLKIKAKNDVSQVNSGLGIGCSIIIIIVAVLFFLKFLNFFNMDYSTIMIISCVFLFIICVVFFYIILFTDYLSKVKLLS